MTSVDLVTGFLGAGKTTFIQHYIAYLKPRGNRVAVVENEFGLAGIDAAVLEQTGIDISELAGGCVCCSLQVDFAYRLQSLAGQYERIIVEPSGIFSLESYVDVINGPVLEKCCRQGMMATVVDAMAIHSLPDEAMIVLLSQLHGTGTVLLSRTGQMTDAQIDAARGMLDALMLEFFGEEGLASLRGRVCAKDWASLGEQDFQGFISRQPVALPYQRKETPHSRLFCSITLYPDQCYDMEGARAMLQDFFDERCGRVLRVKGYVRALEGSLLLNATPCAQEVSRCGAHDPMINIIGVNVRRSACRDAMYEHHSSLRLS